MLAFVGLLVTEQPFEFHPLFTMGNKDIGPAMYVHLFLFELFACIGSLLRSSHLLFYCIFFSCSCTFLLCRSTQPSRHLDEVRAVAPKFFFALSAVIGLAELGRALTGFETPGNFKKDGDGNNNALKPNYYPGTLLSFYSLNSSFECLYAVDSINSFIKC